MSHKYYTSSQRAELLLHPGVLSCTEKYLCFTPEFKKQALELYLQEYMVPRRIFQHLGLPLFVTETTLPKNALKDWKNHFKKEGITGLASRKKGRKKKEKPPGFSSSEEELEYLRAKVGYLEAQNEVFALIRAGKYQ